MSERSRVPNLVMVLVGFVVFMVLVLQVVGGFGVGTVELLIWLALLAGGIALIVGRYRAASRPTT